MSLMNIVNRIEKRKREICMEQELINNRYRARRNIMTESEKVETKVKLERLNGEMNGLSHVLDIMIEEVGD